MKKLSCLISIISLLLLCTTITVSAHSGKTDSEGGHYDYSTGEYHYHHGYPEHQHINGICPYNYVDQTGDDSDRRGNSYDDIYDSGYEDGYERGKEDQIAEDNKNKKDPWRNVGIALLISSPWWINLLYSWILKPLIDLFRRIFYR